MEDEDQRAQDERVEKLWHTLDTQREGKLSLDGLKRGLQKLDHRRSRLAEGNSLADAFTALQNADSLLQDVMKVVDTNRDGNIQYSGM